MAAQEAGVSCTRAVVSRVLRHDERGGVCGRVVFAAAGIKSFRFAWLRTTCDHTPGFARRRSERPWRTIATAITTITAATMQPLPARGQPLVENRIGPVFYLSRGVRQGGEFYGIGAEKQRAERRPPLRPRVQAASAPGLAGLGHLHHRRYREKISVHRAHVDVPA